MKVVEKLLKLIIAPIMALGVMTVAVASAHSQVAGATDQVSDFA